jgi:cytidylate kinase
MAAKLSITIGRQYGSGGKDIGIRLGELLGFRVYDRDLLFIAAQKNGINPDALRRVDEKANNSLLYTLAMGTSLYGARNFGIDVPINDQLFITQTDIIKKAAEEENCIFVGRCADYVLRNHPNRISVFVYADKDTRIARIREELGVDRDEAVSLINKTDKRRINYYNFYTGKKWGKAENYHVCIDSSLLGIEGSAQMIADIARLYMTKEQDQEVE